MNAQEIAAISMQHDIERVSQIGHNLVNLSTPGFKRVQGLVPPTSYQALQAGQESLLAATRPVTSQVDLASGALSTTGRSLDLAIEGQGFFVLQSEAGQKLTRRGDFYVDATGLLVTHDGSPVMGTNGHIQINSDSIRIDAAGRVFDQEKQIDQLRIVTVNDPASLKTSGGDSLLVDDGAVSDATQATYRVMQGHLEGSNVSSASEMIKLVEFVKHIEANQRVLQYQDEMLGKALDKFIEL